MFCASAFSPQTYISPYMYLVRRPASQRATRRCSSDANHKFETLHIARCASSHRCEIGGLKHSMLLLLLCLLATHIMPVLYSRFRIIRRPQQWPRAAVCLRIIIASSSHRRRKRIKLRVSALHGVVASDGRMTLENRPVRKSEEVILWMRHTMRCTRLIAGRPATREPPQ